MMLIDHVLGVLMAPAPLAPVFLVAGVVGSLFPNPFLTVWRWVKGHGNAGEH